MTPTPNRPPLYGRLRNGRRSGRLKVLLGPFEVVLTYAGVVILLLVFILIERDDISDRVVQLVGWGKIGVTTKTLNLIGNRLSRYLLPCPW